MPLKHYYKVKYIIIFVATLSFTSYSLANEIVLSVEGGLNYSSPQQYIYEQILSEDGDSAISVIDPKYYNPKSQGSYYGFNIQYIPVYTGIIISLGVLSSRDNRIPAKVDIIDGSDSDNTTISNQTVNYIESPESTKFLVGLGYRYLDMSWLYSSISLLAGLDRYAQSSSVSYETESSTEENPDFNTVGSQYKEQKFTYGGEFELGFKIKGVMISGTYKYLFSGKRGDQYVGGRLSIPINF